MRIFTATVKYHPSGSTLIDTESNGLISFRNIHAEKEIGRVSKSHRRINSLLDRIRSNDALTRFYVRPASREFEIKLIRGKRYDRGILRKTRRESKGNTYLKRNTRDM